jgi:PAS domain-containing protein
LLSRKPRAFNEDQVRLLVAAANQVASAINNADLYQLIRDQAERLGTLLRAEQEEAEKSHAILEGIADGVILADAEGVVILFNSAAERILQLPREQVLGQQLSKLTGLYGGAAGDWVGAI